MGCTVVGRRNVGLPFPMGQCVDCHCKFWTLEVLLGLQGKDRILSISNFSLETHFHSEGGWVFSRVTGREKLLQLLHGAAWRGWLPCLEVRRPTPCHSPSTWESLGDSTKARPH